MKYLLFFFALITVYWIGTAPRTNNPYQEDWVSLFNGTDLSNWDAKIKGFPLNKDPYQTFLVKDELLTVSYDNYPGFDRTFGHLIHQTPYSYYLLRAEYRFIGDQVEGGPGWAFRNNGLMLHSQSAQSMDQDQDFPISIEVQLLGGNGQDERSTLNLCTPGTHVVMNDKLFTPHCTSSSSKTYHGDQWVTVEVLVLGDSTFKHIVEGDTVLQYFQPQIGGRGLPAAFNKRSGELLSGGHIAIQAESHPTQFRSIELLNLKGCMDPKAKNFKHYYLQSDPDDCVY